MAIAAATQDYHYDLFARPLWWYHLRPEKNHYSHIDWSRDLRKDAIEALQTERDFRWHVGKRKR